MILLFTYTTSHVFNIFACLVGFLFSDFTFDFPREGPYPAISPSKKLADVSRLSLTFPRWVI